ncbi:hypothetical protein B9W62_09435 [Streptomyces sp. CS113]|nr:hypothetical protein B9W62_09435 [Streptomyces sp. CS113]
MTAATLAVGTPATVRPTPASTTAEPAPRPSHPTFTLANSNHRSHPAQTRALHRYLRWRNTNARHPDVLADQRRIFSLSPFLIAATQGTLKRSRYRRGAAYPRVGVQSASTRREASACAAR